MPVINIYNDVEPLDSSEQRSSSRRTLTASRPRPQPRRRSTNEYEHSRRKASEVSGNTRSDNNRRHRTPKSASRDSSSEDEFWEQAPRHWIAGSDGRIDRNVTSSYGTSFRSDPAPRGLERKTYNSAMPTPLILGDLALEDRRIVESRHDEGASKYENRERDNIDDYHHGGKLKRDSGDEHESDDSDVRSESDTALADLKSKADELEEENAASQGPFGSSATGRALSSGATQLSTVAEVSDALPQRTCTN